MISLRIFSAGQPNWPWSMLVRNCVNWKSTKKLATFRLSRRRNYSSQRQRIQQRLAVETPSLVELWRCFSGKSNVHKDSGQWFEPCYKLCMSKCMQPTFWMRGSRRLSIIPCIGNCKVSLLREDGPRHCSASTATQFPRSYFIIHESRISWNRVIWWWLGTSSLNDHSRNFQIAQFYFINENC